VKKGVTKRVNFKLTLKINTKSPLHIGTGEGFSSIIDVKTLTHKQNNKRFPIILGHTVKGVIKNEFKKLGNILKDNSFEKKLFGEKTQQGNVFFTHWELSERFKSMFIHTDTNQIYGVKAGNQIDRFRKVAKEKHLFTHEVVEAPVEWQGSVEGNLSHSDSDNEKALCLLLLAIKSVSNIGGRRRVGLGDCEIVIETLEINDEVKENIPEYLQEKVNSLVGGVSS
jgi:CRISPR/Cas system CSM-associated protein Csm3 (group 7 of RAMP superfamily)